MNDLIGPKDRVADVAARFPDSRRVFDRHGIDPAAGSRMTLAAAAADRGLRSERLITEIVGSAAAQAPASLQTRTLDDIMRRMLSCYHAKLHNDLPEAQRLIEQAQSIAGKDAPGLAGLAQSCASLRALVEEHSGKEERLVFPLIRQLEQGAGRRRLPVATLAPVLSAMEREHARVEQTLAFVRELTEVHLAPEAVCAASKRLRRALERLDRELLEHTRLEEEVVFPRALELERRALSGRVR